MIKNIKPYKIDIGDTIIFRGVKDSTESDLYEDSSSIDLAGRRLLVVDIEYSEEEGNYCLYLRCNTCKDLHDVWISDDDMNNTWVTVFRDDSNSNKLYGEIYQ
jgi:hypothetical protein